MFRQDLDRKKIHHKHIQNAPLMAGNQPPTQRKSKAAICPYVRFRRRHWWLFSADFILVRVDIISRLPGTNKQ